MDVGMEDGMNDSQRIFAKLKPMVEAKVAGCEDCGGSGEHPCDKRCSEYYYDVKAGCAGNYNGPDVSSNGCPPCPTCARRENDR